MYPGDVERALMTHPSVADAGVVGRPMTSGEVVPAAFVVLAPGLDVDPEVLLAFGREVLPGHAAPTTIWVVDELPRNSVGKLVRDELRVRMSARQIRG